MGERLTQESVLLNALRHRPQTTNELCAIHTITTDGRHISLARELTRITSTLRKRGYQIVYTHAKGGTGTYRLISEPTETGQAQLGFMQAPALGRRM